jgi:hypothetical protein
MLTHNTVSNTFSVDLEVSLSGCGPRGGGLLPAQMLHRRRCRRHEVAARLVSEAGPATASKGGKECQKPSTAQAH